jgi:hypothetical protein
MISKENLDSLRNELSVNSKNGMDFTLAASIVWLIIAYVWTLEMSSYNKSVVTFIVGGAMMPLAMLFSKLLKTTWTNKNNPLQPLGLWLNFAQLFYFPFLIFILIKQPDYIAMVYVIITGAHFFPYSWFYKTPYFAIFAGVISIGSLFLGLYLPPNKLFYIPACMSAALLLLTTLLYFDSKKRATVKSNN